MPYRRKYRTKRRVYRKKGRKAYRSRRTYRRRSTATPMDIVGSGAYRMKTIRGKGSYWGDTGSKLGSMAGSALGRLAGEGFGGIIGGNGAYQLNATSHASDASQVPAMHSFNETIRITHREYLRDVISSPTANQDVIYKIAINPGNQGCFPWLSGIAQNFQQYTMKGLAFQFRSNSGEAVTDTNTALGSITMMASYDVADADPETKAEMLANMWAVQGKPSQNIMMPVECDPKQNPFKILYVRGEGIPTGKDPQMFDLANFYMLINGVRGESVNLGELWISYDVELRKPSSVGIIGTNINTAMYGELDVEWLEAADMWEGDYLTRVDMIGITHDNENRYITLPNGIPGCWILGLRVAHTDGATPWQYTTAPEIAAKSDGVTVYRVATDGVEANTVAKITTVFFKTGGGVNTLQWNEWRTAEAQHSNWEMWITQVAADTFDWATPLDIPNL